MNYEHFGILLRELRESRNLTREQLAENICTTKQIYRIEKGLYEPSLYLLNQLSIKFNVDLNEYFKIYFSNTSIITYEGIKSINAALQNLDLKQVRKLIDKYKNYKEFKQGDNLQHILYGQAICAARLDNNYEESLYYCMKGMLLEHPNFTLDNIRESVYSNVGLSILNCMSRNYIALNKRQIGIKILKDLLFVIEDYLFRASYPLYKSTEFTKKIYQNTLYNLSDQLIECNDYQNALLYVNQGIDYSLKEYNMRFLPELLFMKCRLLYNEEKFVEAKPLYQQSINLLHITSQTNKLNDLEQYVTVNFPKLLTP